MRTHLQKSASIQPRNSQCYTTRALYFDAHQISKSKHNIPKSLLNGLLVIREIEEILRDAKKCEKHFATFAFRDPLLQYPNPIPNAMTQVST